MKFTARFNLHQQLGDYLRQKRIESGFTQIEIAKKLGYSNSQFVSNFERGLCSPPLKNLKTLMKIYNIHNEDLIVMILQEQESYLRSILSCENCNKKPSSRRAVHA